MGRLARVVAVDVPHHVTQRGNARQSIFAGDADRTTYLALLRQYCEVNGLGLLGYCLMSNHVHLIAVPHTADAMAQALKQAHGRYATYWNACQSSSGHVWQGRFYSCPLDTAHLWEALRYVELNPVRAGMVETPQEWRWSSALAHCGELAADPLLEMEPWAKRWTAREWETFLAYRQSESEARALRQCTHTGRPLGEPGFVAGLEASLSRPLAPQKGGRPKKTARADGQTTIGFVA
jgi:putative transposase